MLACVSTLLAAFQSASIANGDFEAKLDRDGEIHGWKLAAGARNGGTSPSSEVVLDPAIKHGGKQSLRFTGDNHTRVWQIATQEIDVLPGATCTLRAFAKTENVRPEKVEGEIPQFMNCYVGVFLLDRRGEVVAKECPSPKRPTTGWQELTAEIKAPDSARRARVAIFLSMSGKLWVDDVKLETSGGHEVPKPASAFVESFEQATSVPSEWHEEEGAQNGGQSPRLRIEIDPNVGAPGSPRSLLLAGDASTRLWNVLRRSFPVSPGDVVRLKAKVKAEGIHQEGIQFANFHLHVFFRDKDGKSLEPARFAHPGTGSYDWKDVEVENTAPDGADEAVVGVFLSMSGRAWIDRIEVTTEKGGVKPYADWASLDTKHLTLRYPNDHPRAAKMAEYGKRLDDMFEQICRRASVTYDERITAFLYRDPEQGKAMTGRELDFADPAGRAIHQSPNSTLGHEMTHVIFRNVGAAQAALLGEGVAVYLNGAPPESHHARAAKLLADGKLPTVDALLRRFREEAEGYPAAGSFCGYVIEKYGMDRFKRLYLELDVAAASKPVLGVELSEIESKWRESLAPKTKAAK